MHCVLGSSFTHVGRFSSLCEGTGPSHATSLSQLTERAEATRWFLQGLLAGQMPSPFQALGEQLTEMHADQAAWSAAEVLFREKGRDRKSVV